MKNKLLLVIVAALMAGCADKVEYETVLKDPITLNLVKQSIGDSMYQLDFGLVPGDYVHNYYNSCSSFSRLKTSFVLFFHPMASGTYRQISCDALDLRLNNKGINTGYFSFTTAASPLVGYYMNEQIEAQEKAENQRIKDDAVAKQLLIENMASGK